MNKTGMYSKQGILIELEIQIQKSKIKIKKNENLFLIIFPLLLLESESTFEPPTKLGWRGAISSTWHFADRQRYDHIQYSYPNLHRKGCLNKLPPFHLETSLIFHIKKQ